MKYIDMSTETAEVVDLPIVQECPKLLNTMLPYKYIGKMTLQKYIHLYNYDEESKSYTLDPSKIPAYFERID